MMGSQEEAPQLFYDFWLEDHVPAGHMLSGIDRFLDLSSLRAELALFYISIDVMVFPGSDIQENLVGH